MLDLGGKIVLGISDVYLLAQRKFMCCGKLL